MKKKKITVLLSNIRRAISLKSEGLSGRMIASELGVSPSTVKRWNKRWAEYAADRPDEDMTDELLYSVILRTPGPKPEARKVLNFEDISAGLENGATIQQEYERYQEGPRSGPDPVGPSTFYRRVSTYLAETADETRKMTQEWKPGEYMQIDYAGDVIELTPGPGNKKYKARIFVAVLCHSRYVFAWATPDMTTASWTEGLVRALEYFGGAPKYIIFDNDVALVTRASRGNKKFTKLFEDACSHYNILMTAARVGEPRDKGIVENSVKFITTNFITPIPKRSLPDIEAVNGALAAELARLNNKVMKSHGISRREWFESAEKKYLQPLPAVGFTVEGTVVERKVDKNSMVRFDGHAYRMPERCRERWVQICLLKDGRLKFTEKAARIEITTYPHYTLADIRAGKGVVHEHPEFRRASERTPAERLKEVVEQINSLHASAQVYFNEFLRRRKGESGAVAEMLRLFFKKLKPLAPTSVEWACAHLTEMGVYDPEGILMVLKAAAGKEAEGSEQSAPPSGGKGALLHKEEDFCCERRDFEAVRKE